MTLTSPAVVLILLFQSDPRLPRAVEAAALDEAAQIWAPYGVAVRRTEPCRPPDDGTTLVVMIAREPVRSGPASSWSATFGAIRFADGVPQPEITLFSDAVLRLLETISLRDKREAEWPTTYRHLILGRVLGRALAHEIGHFLLRSRGHATAGLMRPQQSLGDLVDADRRHFALSAGDEARWRLLRDGERASTAASAHRADTARRRERPGPRTD